MNDFDMLDAESKIEKIKFESLCAIKLHTKRLQKLKKFSKIFLMVKFTLPIISIAAMYQFKGTPYFAVITVIGFWVSTILLLLSGLIQILKLEEQISSHKSAIQNDNNIVTEINANVKLAENEENLKDLIQKASEADIVDNNMLKWKSKKERQKVYREVLIEYGGSEVKCPVCGLSPFIFVKGKFPCEACGNVKE